jgi:hypothetical protein
LVNKIITLAHGIKAVSDDDGKTVASVASPTIQMLQDNWEAIAAHDHATIYYTQDQIADLLSLKSDSTHTHDDKANLLHTHSDKADVVHDHNSLYYTKAEIDALLIAVLDNI